MVDKTTGAMQAFGAPAAPGAHSRSGLVLLYTEAYASLPGAILLEQERQVIGRDEGVEICLPVTAVSRRHAEISWERGAWVLRDLGSRNGIIMEGRQVLAEELEAGNEIRIGDAVFKFVDKHAELYVPYRIDGSVAPGFERKGRSPKTMVGGYHMDRIAADLARIAPTPLSVMLLGESGTGKEVVSRELHALSGRRGDFHAVNCAAIPGQLLESELFGYKRGAFSGADRDKPGLIKLADQGTLLLDEIGDMPLEAQAKLLRVLQNKEVFPLGGTAAEHVDVRIVCATHRDLWRLQEAGKFREDLFARLNEYQLRLPPLRERKEDIYMLTRAFLTRHGRPEVRTTFAFMLALLHYDWPYNVRELEACIKRCLALTDRATLERDLIPDAVRDAMTDYAQPKTEARGSVTPATPDPELAAHSALPTEEELRALLLRHQGNVAAVGRELGKARMQIHRWMKRYGIQIEDYRS